MTHYKVDKDTAEKLAPYIQQVLTAGYLRGWSTAKTLRYTAKSNNMVNGYSKLMSVYKYMVEHNMPTTAIG